LEGLDAELVRVKWWWGWGFDQRVDWCFTGVGVESRIGSEVWITIEARLISTWIASGSNIRSRIGIGIGIRIGIGIGLGSGV
jgi:hypothetical protein